MVINSPVVYCKSIVTGLRVVYYPSDGFFAVGRVSLEQVAPTEPGLVLTVGLL